MPRAFTDYPINGSTGVIEVETLAYDRNKYVTVRYGDVTTEVKSGYLHLDAGLQRHYGARRLHELPQEVGAARPTRRQVHAELMASRRRHHAKYTLWVGDEKYAHSTLREALRHFGRVFHRHDCTLMRARAGGHFWSSESVVESKNGTLIIPVQYGKASIALFRDRHRRQLTKR